MVSGTIPVDTVRIVEGNTRLVVPAGSVSGVVPPRRPAFFNPRARRTRDLAVLAAGAHAEGRPGTYLDAMAGVGARGLRVAAEAGSYDVVFLNDSNPHAVEMARQSAALNDLGRVAFSNMEACRFLCEHSVRGGRGAAVDVDPFGSPAPYLDCALRALEYGGMLAVTATDLQVLGGLHDDACRRIYGGVPLWTAYGAETAVRLVAGCVSAVAGRLDAGISVLHAESHMHYYRVYARLLSKPGSYRLGYVVHCHRCGDRYTSETHPGMCGSCGGDTRAAGPLWTGPLFDADFVGRMALRDMERNGGVYAAYLEKCRREAAMPAAFYTLDEVASRVGTGPPPLRMMLERLRGEGFSAEATSFAPTGFRTDAPAADVCRILSSAKSHAHKV